MKSSLINDFEHGQRLLQRKLERLVRKFGWGEWLKIVWKPGQYRAEGSKHIMGEVVHDTIYRYDMDIEGAEKGLLHEFLEAMLQEELQEPLLDIVKAIMDTYANKLMYRQRERLINRLAKQVKQKHG